MRTTRSVVAELFGLIALVSLAASFVNYGDYVNELGITGVIATPLILTVAAIYAILRGNYIINDLNSNWDPRDQ